MRKTILTALLVTALAAPALAQSYPVTGRFGESDSSGGVPEYRNKSVQSTGQSDYRVVDEFSNGQVSAGHTEYTLRKVDSDRIVMNQSGTVLNLQRCK